MTATAAPAPDTFTCAMPGCGARTTDAQATYIDGCGQVCPACDPMPEGMAELIASGFEPPY